MAYTYRLIHRYTRQGCFFYLYSHKTDLSQLYMWYPWKVYSYSLFYIIAFLVDIENKFDELPKGFIYDLR